MDYELEEIERLLNKQRAENEETNRLIKELIELLKPVSHHYEREYKLHLERIEREERRAGKGVSITELGLSGRVARALSRSGYKEVSDLIKVYEKKKPLHGRGIGAKAREEIIEKLKERGFINEM